ncbi:MAG: N-acetylmuramoyl-L-alanine amidase [Clostridiales bacterium]|nr:N-acetylmuramoyl-L-alanine amidase [Clostridiales bacterium]
MNRPEDKPNHSGDTPDFGKAPDLSEFSHPSSAPEEPAETVDLEALLHEIRRVPSNGNVASSNKKTPPSAPSAKSSEDIPVRKPVTETAPSLTQKESVDEASDPSEEEDLPVISRTPARRVPSDPQRIARIRAKRRRVSIMLGVTAVLLVAAIGMGIFYAVSSLSSNKKSDTSVTTSSSVMTDTQTSTTEQVTSETTTENTEPTPTPTPAVTPFPAGGPDLTGYCVVIDPGHQAVPNLEQEPMSSSMGGSKDKSAQGFTGVVTGTDESEIDLQTALLLRDYLQSLGCEVYITRETNDVDISNKERAEFAVSHDPDLYIRLFCNAANDSLTNGCLVIVPSSGKYSEQVAVWGDNLGKAISSSCGCAYNGCKSSSNYSGLNWADSVPSFMVRMGYLTNSDEEAHLLDEEYQYEICQGIAQFVSTMAKR